MRERVGRVVANVLNFIIIMNQLIKKLKAFEI